MPNPAPIILSLNLFDPSHRSGLPAETLDIVRQDCQPMSVVTALSVQDSLHVEEFKPVDSACIDAQARCLLEDLTPSLIKVSALGTPEACAVTAQILSDYEQIPSVLLVDPMNFSEVEASPEDDGHEFTLSALLNLVAPLSDFVVIEASRMAQWLPEHICFEEVLDELFDQKVSFCIVLGNRDGAGPENLIYGSEGGQIYLADKPGLAGNSEFAEFFTTALACSLAHGNAIIDASQQAMAASRRHFDQSNQLRIGMGRGLAKRHIFPAVREQ